MKKRKRLIIISSILATIALIVILSSTIFTLSNIGVEYRTTLNYLSEAHMDEVVESGKFSLGKSIFFADFGENIEQIEKSNPYIKVVNIERKFPNSAIINVAERVPVVKVKKSENTWLILDNELKVINIVDNNNYITKTGEDTVPELSIMADLDFCVDKGAEVGSFLDNETLKKYVDAFYRGAYAYKQLGTSIMEKISISYDNTLECLQYEIEFRNSDTIGVICGENNLQDVVYKVVATFASSGNIYSSIYSTTEGVVYGVKK